MHSFSQKMNFEKVPFLRKRSQKMNFVKKFVFCENVNRLVCVYTDSILRKIMNIVNISLLMF